MGRGAPEARGDELATVHAVPYRNSGIEWLGRIPSHWEVKQLKTLCFVQSRYVDKISLDEVFIRL